MTEYDVVFDVATAGYRQWTFPAFGLIFIAIAVAFAIYELRRAPPGARARSRILFAIAYGGFATVWTISAFWSTYADYLRLRRALDTGAYEVVEGAVTDLVPMPKAGHALEHFVVDGHRFAYSDFVVTAGFNTTTAYGGPIREGLRVRIADVGGEIARLEIATAPR